MPNDSVTTAEIQQNLCENLICLEIPDAHATYMASPEDKSDEQLDEPIEDQYCLTTKPEVTTIEGKPTGKIRESLVETPLEYTKSTIIIEQGQLDLVLDKAEEVLCNTKCNVYQRSGSLVTIAKASAFKRANKKLLSVNPDEIIIKETDIHYLSEVLTKNALWAKSNEKGEIGKYINCPKDISQHIISRPSWNIPNLFGVISAPTLRKDGSILDKEGYDELTGLFFATNGTIFEKIPENSSKNDAEKALEIIFHILKDFPFNNDESKSVAIAAILTTIIRKSIETAPMFCFSAPKMGTGKTLLADICSLIATGKRNSVISQACTEEEDEKRLLAALGEGRQILCIDNIERPLSGAMLCSMLTSTSVSGRILGHSKMASYSSAVAVFATGNNLVLIGDISTRALLCQIESKEERPEERELPDLPKYILKNRSKIVAACLTILRAYCIAGKPKQNIKQFGRFEEWSNWVRSSIVWLGLEDPCKSRKEIENMDPTRIKLIDILEAIQNVYEETPFTVSELILKAQSTNEDQSIREKIDELRRALIEFCPDSRGITIDVRAVGTKITAFKNRRENGLFFEPQPQKHKTNVWKVKKVL